MWIQYNCFLSAISYQHKHSPVRGINCQGILQDAAPPPCRAGSETTLRRLPQAWGRVHSTCSLKVPRLKAEKSNFQILVYHGTREQREVFGKGTRGKKSNLGRHCGNSEPSGPGHLTRATRDDNSVCNCERKRQRSQKTVLFGVWISLQKSNAKVYKLWHRYEEPGNTIKIPHTDFTLNTTKDKRNRSWVCGAMERRASGQCYL